MNCYQNSNLWSNEVLSEFSLDQTLIRHLVASRAGGRIFQSKSYNVPTCIATLIGQNTQMTASLLLRTRAAAHEHNHVTHSNRFPRCFSTLSQSGILDFQQVWLLRRVVPFQLNNPSISKKIISNAISGASKIPRWINSSLMHILKILKKRWKKISIFKKKYDFLKCSFLKHF